MIIYLLKSIFGLAILLLVYLLFLEKEKMHCFNRWYLLASIVFACMVPLVSFDVSAGSLPVLQNDYFEIIVSGYNQPDQTIKVQKESVDYLTPSLWIIYLLGASVLLIRFARNLYRILLRAKKNRSVIYQDAKLVLLKERTASYSFLNNIFITEKDYTDRVIETELLTHELTHVKEKHSWDVIFIELVQVILWFNPVLIFYKKAIQRNHEYLADDAVIKTYGNIPAYQNLLLDKISSGQANYMTSSFGYLSTKKRLVMMTRTCNKARSIFKQVFLLPVLVVILFAFSSKEVLAKQTISVEQTVAPKQKNPGKQPVGILRHPLTEKTPYTKEGVSQVTFNEYVAFQNKYGYTDEKGHSLFHFENIQDEERNRMEWIFKRMTREQQSNVNLIFFPPISPIKIQRPTDELLRKWKNDRKSYAVTVGDKKINNDELSNYKASDFAHYAEHFLTPNARKITGHGVQINLMTAEEFKDMNDRIKNEKRFSLAWLVIKTPAETK
jgi:bla regulator protein BlaR1